MVSFGCWRSIGCRSRARRGGRRRGSVVHFGPRRAAPIGRPGPRTGSRTPQRRRSVRQTSVQATRPDGGQQIDTPPPGGRIDPGCTRNYKDVRPLDSTGMGANDSTVIPHSPWPRRRPPPPGGFRSPRAAIPGRERRRHRSPLAGNNDRYCTGSTAAVEYRPVDNSAPRCGQCLAIAPNMQVSASHARGASYPQCPQPVLITCEAGSCPQV